MLTSMFCPTPTGFSVKLMWAIVSRVTSRATPAGRGMEDGFWRFVGVTPAGIVVCACVGAVISIREAFVRITIIIAVAFMVFFDFFVFLFSLGLFAKLGKASKERGTYSLPVTFTNLS